MNRKEFFSAMQQAAEKDGAEVIDVDIDTPAIDLRGEVSERPLLVLSARPDLSILASGCAMPGLLAIGWRGPKHKGAMVAVEADIAMPECWEAYQAEEGEKGMPFQGGFGVRGFLLDISRAIIPGSDMTEYGGIAAVKEAIDLGASGKEFGLHNVGEQTVGGVE